MDIWRFCLRTSENFDDFLFNWPNENARIIYGDLSPQVPASLSDNKVLHSRVLKTSFLSSALPSTQSVQK